MYTKSKKMQNIYIYPKIRTPCKKQDNLRYILYTKSETLYVTQFSWFFQISIYIQKHDTLRYMTFLYPKSETLRKKQDSLRHVFIYAKILTLTVTRFFMEFLKLAEGGAFIYAKKNA